MAHLTAKQAKEQSARWRRESPVVRIERGMIEVHGDRPIPSSVRYLVLRDGRRIAETLDGRYRRPVWKPSWFMTAKEETPDA